MPVESSEVTPGSQDTVNGDGRRDRPTHPVDHDTRGIMAPRRVPQFATLSRFEAQVELAGLVDWFWCVEWDLPSGVVHRQRVLTQPGVNVSVGTSPPPGDDPPPGPWPLTVMVDGVATRMTTRALSGRGFNLAAKSTTGGFGAWIDDVSALTDTTLPAAGIIPLGDTLARDIADAARTSLSAAVDVLASGLLGALHDRPEERIATAREVARIARVAETDRTIRRVADLAALAGSTPRTLQRLFARYAGVSPTWVIRRFRLLEAAEFVRDGEHVEWSAVAADLGYSDQAHLVRDFTANIGTSPAAYARAQRPD